MWQKYLFARDSTPVMLRGVRLNTALSVSLFTCQVNMVRTFVFDLKDYHLLPAVNGDLRPSCTVLVGIQLNLMARFELRIILW